MNIFVTDPYSEHTNRLLFGLHYRAGGHFWATVCKTVRPMLSEYCPVCLSVMSCLSVCDVGVLWPNG